MPEGRRLGRSRALADRAVAQLRRAAAAGYRDVAHIGTDTDLDPLRSRPDFPTFLMDLTFPADPFAQ
jgi:hypothetical protein